MSYESGNGGPDEEGVLDAAFDGQHGWYWSNPTEEDVTVTLRTKRKDQIEHSTACVGNRTNFAYGKRYLRNLPVVKSLLIPVRQVLVAGSLWFRLVGMLQ